MEWGQLLSSYDGHGVNYGLDGFTTSLFYDDRYEYAWEHGHQLRYLYEFFTEYYFCEYYFAYDANGMRTKMVRNTTDLECDQYWKDTYEYTYNGTQLTRMTYEGEAGWYTLDIRYDADGTPVSVTFEHVAHEPDMENGGYLDESSAYDCCSGTYYYITNLQGDVIALVDENGDLAGTYTYDAWGNIVARTSKECIASANPLRYRSYVYDTQTGFYYLQSRYYDPVKGRFISPDAFVSTGQGILGNNMFAYCLNNPVNLVDTDGKSPTAAFASWGSSMWWLSGVDGPLPIGEVIYGIGLIITGVVTLIASIYVSLPSITLEEEKNETDPPDVTYPGDDPSKSPGDDYEWRGKQPVGGDKGAWVNGNTGEQWHPDMNHKPPKGPHWDYTDALGKIWSVFKDGRIILWK